VLQKTGSGFVEVVIVPTALNPGTRSMNPKHPFKWRHSPIRHHSAVRGGTCVPELPQLSEMMLERG